ncbi:hypothetical protein E4A41_02030 [Micrococcus endophyticus]|nr:hypothetical protein E4A41_02030 [Micrococcus endophyticus]
MRNTRSADSCREWQVQGGRCSPGTRPAVMLAGTPEEDDLVRVTGDRVVGFSRPSTCVDR